MMQKIAVFASGQGTNFQQMVYDFKNHSSIKIAVLVSDRPNCGAVKFAQSQKIPVILLSKRVLSQTNWLQTALADFDVNWLVLAGFLLQIPAYIVDNYKSRIINLHPSLLPKYGGKGMYGNYVHQAVLANQESKSGITIHLVNEAYDDGPIIAQFELNLDPDETVERLQQKINKLELSHYPHVVAQYILEHS